MEFRYPFLVMMQEQNLKLYRRLRDSGELDGFVEMKAREAAEMYQAMLQEGPQPPTLAMEREAQERVQAEMFQFSDDTTTAEQDEAKTLFGDIPPDDTPRKNSQPSGPYRWIHPDEER
jgi:hypothetical protein